MSLEKQNSKELLYVSVLMEVLNLDYNDFVSIVTDDNKAYYRSSTGKETLVYQGKTYYFTFLQ